MPGFIYLFSKNTCSFSKNKIDVKTSMVCYKNVMFSARERFWATLVYSTLRHQTILLFPSMACNTFYKIRTLYLFFQPTKINEVMITMKYELI